ncbi:hypothetical protein [Nonomuraea sp. NPDC049758]|uniref:hypothetical protein n=1 Tax=Nonomuraea sp. NPDC049758 TaxID=3154360 RepID=UPI0034163E96
MIHHTATPTRGTAARLLITGMEPPGQPTGQPTGQQNGQQNGQPAGFGAAAAIAFLGCLLALALPRPARGRRA